MAVGTGIFLGLAILAVVLLYGQTKDRWRWGRIAIWTAVAIATPVLIFAGWLGYEAFQDHQRTRPQLTTEYADISLGDSMAEVRYAKGVPTDVMEPDADNRLRGWLLNIPVAELPKGKQVTDYLDWSYDSEYQGRIDVKFSPESKSVIRVLCYSSKGRSCDSLVGVSSGSSEAHILDRLGEPSSTEIDSASGVKTLRYSQFNATYLLQERQVYMLRLEDEAKFAATQANHPATMAEANAPKLPPVCAGAKDADECAEFLQRDGKNPFDAYGYAGGELPPCKSGTASCKPWERDWKDGEGVPPGAIVSE